MTLYYVSNGTLALDLGMNINKGNGFIFGKSKIENHYTQGSLALDFRPGYSSGECGTKNRLFYL